MAHPENNLEALVEVIFDKIKDEFEEGEAGEWLFTSPLDDVTSYDIYDGTNHAGLVEYRIIINDLPSNSIPPHSTLKGAKRYISGEIARKILEAGAILSAARDIGFIHD